MASSKSPLLRTIRKAFALSSISRQPNAPDIKELVRQVDQAREEYSRRRFIGDVSKAAMFAGLATMLPGCTKEDFASQYEEIEKGKPGGVQPTIAIVGAGLAGLNCAYQLKKRGITSTVYEGSERTGGRVLTKQNFIASGTYTECGGEFIDTGRISQYFDSIGLPQSSFLRKGLEQAYLTEYGREVNDQTAINFLFLFTINPGNANYDIFGLSDERFKVQGGNQQIPDALVSNLQGQIQLNRKLVKISFNAAGKYVLQFQTGPNVTADICVLTLPFTLLRLVNLTELNLPSWKTNTIQNLGYGSNAKLLLGFTGKKWRDYGHSGGVFSNGTATPSSQFIQTGWDNTRLQTGSNGGYTVYQGGNQGTNLSLSQASTMLNHLNAMWPGTSAQYNGTVKLIHWPSHPWSLASYACWRVGQVTTMMGAEGKKVGNLYFAGEHTSLWFQGYMEGAVETGDTVAKQIALAI